MQISIWVLVYFLVLFLIRDVWRDFTSNDTYEAGYKKAIHELKDIWNRDVDKHAEHRLSIIKKHIEERL